MFCTNVSQIEKEVALAASFSNSLFENNFSASPQTTNLRDISNLSFFEVVFAIFLCCYLNLKAKMI